MLPRFAFGFGYLVLLLVVGLIALGVIFMHGTVPKESGSATVSGIGATVDIDRDSYGIPHIHGATEHDAYFGLGYAEAQDRLFQMELARRVGEGRMSEVFGNRTLPIDVWSHTIGFSRIADQMWLKAGTHTRDVLTAFVSGVNAYLRDHRKHLGFEFDALMLVPENWRPQDCLMIGRLMSWEMNFSALTDAAFGDFSLALDSAHLYSLFPVYPEDGATVLGGANPSTFVSNYIQGDRPVHALPRNLPMPSGSSDSAKKVTGGTTAKKISESTHHRDTTIRSSTFASIIEDASLFDSAVGACVGGGSNSFVVSGSHSTDGAPLLENDTHLQIGTPARWYVAQLSSDDGMDVAGFLIPGLPIIVSGRTADLSWGITNGMADECDYFEERTDSSGARYLLANGLWEPFSVLHDSIHVRDSAASTDGDALSDPLHQRNATHAVPIDVRMTVHGPILTGMHPHRMEQLFYSDMRAGGIPERSIFKKSSRPGMKQIAMMWNGTYALTDELSGFLDLPHARTVTEARKGMASFATPCLNLCLADTHGSISFQYIGRLPRRAGNDERQLLPRDGSNPADAWMGFATMADFPTITNPPRGFIVSANNPPVKNFPVPIGLNWEPSSRADRINELLEEHAHLSAGEFQNIQTDIVSSYDLRRILPYLLALYPDPNPPRIAPDSSALFLRDSMRISWKEDSLLRHTSIGDSAMKSVRVRDSEWIAEHRTAEGAYPIRTEHVDPFTAQVLTYLRNWDGGMRAEEVAPAIYSVFLNRLIYNTFFDGLNGNDDDADERASRYNALTLMQDVPLQALAHLLPDTGNVWWHNTLHRNWNRDSAIQLSFHESLRILAQIFGADMRTWQWGKLHALTLRHPFDRSSALLATLADIPAGPMSGGLTTVLQASYHLWEPYQMQIGPSMRMIADMKDDVLLAVLPSGNSEAIFGHHYRDMLPLYLSKTLIKIDLKQTPAANWERFELKPG